MYETAIVYVVNYSFFLHMAVFTL